MKWVIIVLVLLSPQLRLSAEPMVLIDAVAVLSKDSSTMTTEGKLLAQILAHYPSPYSTEQISLNRATAWVKQAKNACIPWLRKTKARQKDFLFSLPYMLEEPLQLVFLKNSPVLPKLRKLPQPLSLNQLLTNQELMLLGIEQNRSYGETLDSILQHHQQSSSVYLRTSSSAVQSGMMPMLQRRFVDAFIEYPRIARRSNLPLVFFPIAEAEAVNLVHFACSKGAQGQRVVDTLNQVILKLHQQSAYRELALEHIEKTQRLQAAQIWQIALLQPGAPIPSQ